jgi:hypothetical protein
MDPVAAQRFFNFLVSRARAAVIELQDRSRDGRLDASYNERWYARLLEEMVRITVFILLSHLISLLRKPLPSVLVRGNAVGGTYISHPFTRACHSNAPVDSVTWMTADLTISCSSTHIPFHLTLLKLWPGAGTHGGQLMGILPVPCQWVLPCSKVRYIRRTYHHLTSGLCRPGLPFPALFIARPINSRAVVVGCRVHELGHSLFSFEIGQFPSYRVEEYGWRYRGGIYSHQGG